MHIGGEIDGLKMIIFYNDAIDMCLTLRKSDYSN